MTVQLSKSQIAELTAELTRCGLKVTRAPKAKAESDAQRKARFRNWGWKGLPIASVKGVTAAWHVLTWAKRHVPGAVYGCCLSWASDIFAHWAPTVDGHLRRSVPTCLLIEHKRVLLTVTLHPLCYPWRQSWGVELRTLR